MRMMEKQLFSILLLFVCWLSLCSAQPGCPTNETYTECASACEPNCKDPPGRACILMCLPGQCQCTQGYARNASGQCVAKADCPRPSGNPCIGKNEVYRECGSCEPSCAQRNPICTADCRPPACQCAPGYVRNRPKGECVRPSRCPPKLSPCATVKCAVGYQCVVNANGGAGCVRVPAEAEPVDAVPADAGQVDPAEPSS